MTKMARHWKLATYIAVVVVCNTAVAAPGKWVRIAGYVYESNREAMQQHKQHILRGLINYYPSGVAAEEAHTGNGARDPWDRMPARLQNETGSGCKCDKSSISCECCADISIDEIHFHYSSCVTVQYLKSDIGLLLTFSLDGDVIIKKSVSVANPPPICFIPPHIKSLNLCITLSKLDIHGGFSGCVSIKATALHFIKKTFSLGCFHIHLQGRQALTDKTLLPMEWTGQGSAATTVTPP